MPAMNVRSHLLSFSLALTFASITTVVLTIQVGTQPGSVGPREMPARPLPVPTDVSTDMQALIGSPPSPTWNTSPKSLEEWKLLSAPSATPFWSAGVGLAELRERFKLTAEPVIVNGAAAYMITPVETPPQN